MGHAVWYCNLPLLAEFPLPELVTQTTQSSPRLRVSVSVDEPSPGRWVHQWLNEGRVGLSVARIRDQYMLEFGDSRSFTFDPGTGVVACPQPIDAAVRHQLLDQVLPRVLEHLGHMMIHASGIGTAEGAVLFMADTGVGKSTLAASFQTDGVEMLSDDCMELLIDADTSVRCLAAYPSLRLWPDSADEIMAGARYEPMSAGSDKRRVSLSRKAPGTETPVAGICLLAADDDDSPQITFTPVPPARAVSLLIGQCFRLDPTDVAATKRTLERCAALVERVPVVELAYPRDYDRLPEVRDAVLRRAASGDWMTTTQV